MRELLDDLNDAAKELEKSDAAYLGGLLKAAARVIAGQHGDIQVLLEENRKNAAGLAGTTQAEYIRRLLIDTVAELSQRYAKLEIENRELRLRH